MRRSALLLPVLLLAAAPAAAEPQGNPGHDPWADMRIAQAAPHVFNAPRARNSRTMRDYEATPSGRYEAAPGGRPDFAGAPPPSFGGGFIEFLFTGRTASPYAGQLPRPDYMRPQYDMRGDDYDRRYGAPVFHARRDQPDVGAYSRTQVVDPRFNRQTVAYAGKEAPGTIVIDNRQRFLYLVEEGGTAIRYGVGVGRDGFGWSGVKAVTAKKEWPDWRPPDEMLRRRPELPRYMAGGPDNPLGARALYLGDSLYRIHGSNEPHTIGQAVSSGCFRMRNDDVIDLYERVRVGTRVVVL